MMKTALLAGVALMFATGMALAQTSTGAADNSGTSAGPNPAQSGTAGRMGSAPTTEGTGKMGGTGTRMSNDPMPGAKDGSISPSTPSGGSSGR
jgi:hypothetical protein